MDKKFKFQYNWLIINSILIIAIGLYIALLKSTSLFLFDDLLNHYFWDKNYDFPEGTIRFGNFLYSLMGAVMTVWGIIMYKLTKHAIKNKEKWAWDAILISILVWFPIDEFFSIYYKVYFNAIFNIIFLATLIIPLIGIKKYLTNYK